MNHSRIVDSIELGNDSFKQMEARPVLNYSMRTGEEFSLEFMLDRINSRTPSAATTTVNTSGSIDVENIVGGPKEFERGNSSLTDGKSNHSLSHTASGSSSAKMKVLCSFGGQILPRPSDRKLRYVGGETRMIRINKDISWQELKQKTMEIFKENHIIRYQLPGEGLDTLVSVSCDDDLQIMVEEGEVEEGSKKLRMFLFSSSDLEGADYSFASAGGDSDVIYVVAVNGLELGSRKQSLVHDLPITSENSLKELDGQRFEKHVDGGAADLTLVSTPRTGTIACSSSIQSSQSVQPMPSSIEGIHPHLSKGPKMLHTEKAASSYLEERSGPILLHEHTPQDGVTDGHQYDDLQVQQPDSADKERLKTEDPVPQESDPGKVFSLDNHPSTLSGPQEGSTVDHIAVEEALITKSVTEGKHVLSVPDVSLLEDYSSTQHHRPDGNDKFISTDTSFLPSDAGFESDLIDFSNNDQPALHQRVFYSEKIPRDQAEIWSRLSKSDHCLDSQLLISHPHSDNPWQDSISESIDFSQNRVEAAETEDSFLSMKPLHTEPPTIKEGLEQLRSYKMFADEISEANPKHSGYISELNPEEYVLNSINDKGFMNNDRALKTDPETLKEDCLKKCALEVDEQVGGGSKQLPMKQDSPVKHQEDPASSLPELDWGKIGCIDHTGHSNLGLHQPSVVSGSSTVDVPRMETLDVLSMQEREDMLVDINERVPDDFLSNMFSKSVISNDSSGLGQLNIDGVGLSVNMENHKPKRWSYFQKLAQDQSLRKEISLIDMDHHDYPYEFAKFKNEGLKSYDFTTLSTDGNVEAQIDSRKETPREFPHKVAADNTAAPLPSYDPSQVMSEREHENGKHQIRNIGLPPIDPFAGDVDFTSLQVIKNGDLEELKELGSGTFGTVYHGKWRGTDVAIKRLKNSCFTGRSSEQETMSTEFWGEADIISKLHHPNVVAFYGVVQDGPGGTLATVVEFMVDGSLSRILLRKDRQLDHHKKLLIAMDAAFGMEYLHSKNIIHFDLKCDNLLVNLKDPLRPICKVGDFGLSKIRRNTLVSGGVRGTLPWMAPELLNGSSNKVSEKVDVFSFGIVLWEILTGEEPYGNMHYGAIIGGIANNTLRPSIPSYCDNDWRNLMEQCWAPNPAARPSFSQIATRLRTMSAAFPTKVQPVKTSK